MYDFFSPVSVNLLVTLYHHQQSSVIHPVITVSYNQIGLNAMRRQFINVRCAGKHLKDLVV